MGLRDLATVLIRLYGLWVLFHCLTIGQQFFIFRTTYASDPMVMVNFILVIILYAVIGVCLLIFAKTITGWVTPKTSDRLNVIVSHVDLALVSFSFAGIFFFVDGISWLVRDGVEWRFALKSTDLYARMIASLAGHVVKVVFGLFLLFGPRTVLWVVRWPRLEGRFEWKPKREDARNTVELPKILKCPNCGAEYNPEDYSQDVLEWLCPQCRKALPKG